MLVRCSPAAANNGALPLGSFAESFRIESFPFLLLHSLSEGESFRQCCKNSQGGDSRKRSLWISVQVSDILLSDTSGRNGVAGGGLKSMGVRVAQSWAESHFHCLAQVPLLHLQSEPVTDPLCGTAGKRR